jgi:hypothetical protein
MAGIALVRTALPSEPREGSGSLHYWSYEPFDHAPDGSHSVLARDREGCRTLMVINHAGQPIDGMDVEPLMNGAGDAVYLEQYAELMERRQAVGDPSFAPMFAEYPGSPDDDVVA